MDEFSHPKADDLINGAHDLGVLDDFWDETKTKEQNEAAFREAEDEAKELADAYHAAFSTTAGKRVLEDLLDRTLRKPSFIDVASGGVLTNLMEAAPHGFVREGENALVRKILAFMRYSAHGGLAAPEKSKPKEIKDGPEIQKR